MYGETTSREFNEFTSKFGFYSLYLDEFSSTDLMKYYSKCAIELQNKNGKKKAIIRKHRSLPEREFNFEIVNEGIRKRGWI